MVITKQYLQRMIQEETQIVMAEKEIKLFFENQVIPYLRSQRSLLNEQQRQVLTEGISDNVFNKTIKEALRKIPEMDEWLSSNV